MQAIWNDFVVAEPEHAIVVEGNHYFPVDSLHQQYFHATDKQSQCFWKGAASYYTIEVIGKCNENAAWYYAYPLQTAANIRGCVAFWQGVEVVE